jgi:hypothetical protein
MITNVFKKKISKKEGRVRNEIKVVVILCKEIIAVPKFLFLRIANPILIIPEGKVKPKNERRP